MLSSSQEGRNYKGSWFATLCYAVVYINVIFVRQNFPLRKQLPLAVHVGVSVSKIESYKTPYLDGSYIREGLVFFFMTFKFVLYSRGSYIRERLIIERIRYYGSKSGTTIEFNQCHIVKFWTAWAGLKNGQNFSIFSFL